jgi:hypothetical protein
VAANLYSQVHFTEMSKLMFLEDAERDQVDLSARLQDLWRIVDQRLAMLSVLAEGLTGKSGIQTTAQAGSGQQPAISAPAAATPQNVQFLNLIKLNGGML